MVEIQRRLEKRIITQYCSVLSLGSSIISHRQFIFALLFCLIHLVTEGSSFVHQYDVGLSSSTSSPKLASQVDEAIHPRDVIGNEHISIHPNPSVPNPSVPNPGVPNPSVPNASWIQTLPPVSDSFGAPRRAKILLFPPILFESHIFVFKTLGKGLREQFGYELTLYVSDRREIEEDSPYFSVRRFPGIFSTEEAGAFLQKKVSNILSGKPTYLELFDILSRYSKNCDVIFTHGRESIEQLRRDKYDFVIVDPNEMCGFLMAKELDIPYIVFSTGMWIPYEAYVPSPISYVPEFNSELSDKMNFLQRIKNLFIYGISRFGTSYLIFPIYDRLIAKHNVGNVRMGRIVKETKSWLLCTDHALEFPRPLLPHVEYVGGILGRPAKELPPDLKAWADASGQHGGFLIVSFGAGVKRLDPRLESIFINVLSKLPHQVIWRYIVPLKGLGSNIKLVDWFPQNDLLGHPNVRAFIGHGGTNGVYECLYHSVPVVGMPLFGDHYDSMARVHAKEIGILIRWKTLTEKKLMDAINQIINNPKYLMRMRHYSLIHRDQPLTSLQRATHRIDYTIRYNGADHLRPEVFNLSWLQYFLVDIQFGFLVIALVMGWLIHWVIHWYQSSSTKPCNYRYSKKEVEFFPLSTSSTTPTTLDDYSTPSTASGFKSSGFRFLRTPNNRNQYNSTSELFEHVCFIPLLIYHGFGRILLTLCGCFRSLVANIVVNNRGSGVMMRKTSRYFIKCLNVVMDGLRCAFPNRDQQQEQQPPIVEINTSLSATSCKFGDNIAILSDNEILHLSPSISNHLNSSLTQQTEYLQQLQQRYIHNTHLDPPRIPSLSTGSNMIRFTVCDQSSTTADGSSSDENSDQSVLGRDCIPDNSRNTSSSSSTNNSSYPAHCRLPISLIPDHSDSTSKVDGPSVRRFTLSNPSASATASSSKLLLASRQQNSPNRSSPTESGISIPRLHESKSSSTQSPFSSGSSEPFHTDNS